MRILFLGAPGAGKGTQSKKLSARLRLPHLSSGDLLRENVKEGTQTGVVAKSYMDQGNLVPDEILIDMFRARLTGPDCANGFILDGFPRTLVQAKALDQLLIEIHHPLTAVINLQINDPLLVERITGRRTCSNQSCQAVYHVKFSPPGNDMICDHCNNPLIQRSDDKEELVKQRFTVYAHETEPLIEYYDKKLLLKTVDAEGDRDNIFALVLQTLKVPV